MNKPKRGYFDARTPAVTPPTPTINSLKPHDCFVYPRCSALVCPFDPSWRKYWHYRGEAVCSLLKESVKQNTADVFFSTYFAEGLRLLEELRALTPQIIRQHPIVRLQLAAAAESGSRYKGITEGDGERSELAGEVTHD